MRPAALLTAAAVTALVPVATADASSKSTQYLLADPRGDALAFDSLDITCADIAFGKSEIAVRLTLAAAPGNGTPVGGADYRLEFYVSGLRMEFRVLTGMGRTPTHHPSVRVGDSAPPFTYVVDRDALVWRLRRKDMSFLLRPRVVVSRAAATTTFGVTADSAATPGACPR